MASHHPIRKTVAAPPPAIPDKLYFRIGDVARLCAVPTYVLRFWETEFPPLKPHKGGTGQRLYRKKDVEMALRIKSLLYDQGYTIPGARTVLKQESHPGEAAAEVRPLEVIATPRISAPQSTPDLHARIQELQNELLALREMLNNAAGTIVEPQPITKIIARTPKDLSSRHSNDLSSRPKAHGLTVSRSGETRSAESAMMQPGPRLHLNQRDLFDADPAE